VPDISQKTLAFCLVNNGKTLRCLQVPNDRLLLISFAIQNSMKHRARPGQNGQIQILIKMENTTQSQGNDFSPVYCCSQPPQYVRKFLGEQICSSELLCSSLASHHIELASLCRQKS
jgi:hypothetical protein